METEIWKDIEGYIGLYQISNLGRVKSLPRFGTTKEERILKLTQSKRHKYLYVCLCKNNNKKLKRVGRLVALAFIDNPTNKPEVNHINGIKTDNRVSNLEWNTRSENENHAYKNGLAVACRGTKQHNAKLTYEKADEIKKLCNRGVVQRVIAEQYGISQQTVSDINNNKLWIK